MGQLSSPVSNSERGQTNYCTMAGNSNISERKKTVESKTPALNTYQTDVKISPAKSIRSNRNFFIFLNEVNCSTITLHEINPAQQFTAHSFGYCCPI
jgi:hypothetical protein